MVQIQCCNFKSKGCELKDIITVQPFNFCCNCVFMERNIHVKSHFQAKHKMQFPYLTCLQSATTLLQRPDVNCVFVDDCLKVPYGVSTVNTVRLHSTFISKMHFALRPTKLFHNMQYFHRLFLLF